MTESKKRLIDEIGGGQRQEIEAISDRLAAVLLNVISDLKDKIEGLEKGIKWEKNQEKEKKLFMASIICSRPEMTPENAVLFVNKLEGLL